MAACPTHNKEYIYYCQSHQLPLCDTCYVDHYFDPSLSAAQPMIAGQHYSVSPANHEIVKIDKFLHDVVEHMQKELDSFSGFIQQKKS
jgi:hypothetical protein